METKVTKDGFVWLVVPDNYAMEMWKANLATLYVLHNDDSETMVETDLQMADAIHDGERIGIEVGFIKGLLRACPQCGRRLGPQQELNNISTYVVGDFIIKVIDAHNVRITTDRGTVLVCPRSDNSIIVKSSKALENESKDLKIYKEEPK